MAERGALGEKLEAALDEIQRRQDVMDASERVIRELQVRTKTGRKKVQITI